MLSCQVEIPETSKQTFAETPAQSALTVGAEFALVCQGDWPEGFYPEGASKPLFVLGPDDADKIKLLDFQFVDKTTAKILVTSYKPGLNQLKALELKSADMTQDLGPLEWTVASVINPQDPPEGPYGPVGPFRMTIPLAYWVMLFAVIFILVFTMGTKIYRRIQRKKLMSDPRLQESALKPAQQFYQTLRKIQRQFGFFTGAKAEAGDVTAVISQVQEAYQIYISRVFQVPALKWSPSIVAGDIKRRKALIPAQIAKVQINLNELDRASKSKTKTDEKDCMQLIEIVRTNVDQLESLKEGEK